MVQNRTGTRADARANRDRLIEAAHEVLRERGIGAEMKEIAERAGVGIGTIYRNFPTKDDLIVAIVEQMVASIEATLQRALAEPDPIAALRAIMRGGFEMMDRYGDLAAVFHGHMPPQCEAQFEQLGGFRRVGVVIEEGIARGLFRRDLDVELVAARVVASFEPWMYGELRRTRSLDAIVEAHLDLLLHGTLALAAEESGAGSQGPGGAEATLV